MLLIVDCSASLT